MDYEDKTGILKTVDKIVDIAKIYPNIEDASRNAVYIQAYRQASNIIAQRPFANRIKAAKTGLSDAQIEAAQPHDQFSDPFDPDR